MVNYWILYTPYINIYWYPWLLEINNEHLIVDVFPVYTLIYNFPKKNSYLTNMINPFEMKKTFTLFIHLLNKYTKQPINVFIYISLVSGRPWNGQYILTCGTI